MYSYGTVNINHVCKWLQENTHQNLSNELLSVPYFDPAEEKTPFYGDMDQLYFGESSSREYWVRTSFRWKCTPGEFHTWSDMAMRLEGLGI